VVRGRVRRSVEGRQRVEESRSLKRLPSRLRLVADGAGRLWSAIAARGGVPDEVARAAIARGGVFLRGKRVKDPDAAVRAGDRIDVSLQEPQAAPPIPVLYADEDVIAVDKPAGVSAQEDLAGGPALPDLVDTKALLVHRLDKGTTGVCVLARTRKAQSALLEEFRRHRARKEYRALVAGSPERDEGLIDAPVDGAAATTRYQVLERYAGAASIAAFPETGRTHQIRVHLRELGCPLLGDTRYGGPAFVTRPDGSRHDFTRPMLHAFSLEVLGRRVTAPLPADFESARAFLAHSR
jgi:23S rRNA pseudouridine1911/1915/1917 synthase